jgi:hypothetical protein
MREDGEVPLAKNPYALRKFLPIITMSKEAMGFESARPYGNKGVLRCDLAF